MFSHHSNSAVPHWIVSYSYQKLSCFDLLSQIFDALRFLQ